MATSTDERGKQMNTRHISITALQATNKGQVLMGLESSVADDKEVEEFMDQLSDNLEEGMEIVGVEVYTIH